MLDANPAHICIDGTQTRKTRCLLEPYKQQIQELIEKGFQTSQILKRLQAAYPNIKFKRTTLSGFCVKLRTELYEYSECPAEDTVLNGDSILVPYEDRIKIMLAAGKPVTEILSAIEPEGYRGSYSLLQQYCRTIRPITYRRKKSTHRVKRRDIAGVIWSGGGKISPEDMSYIEAKNPVITEIKAIVEEFRTAYSQKDVDAAKSWSAKYSQCQFPAICSFINGINADADAFYNSIKYEFSNGLLEGCVNKLKTVKRSMFGRAGYMLLRAKLLLANSA